MKPLKTKAEIRAELEQEMDRFIRDGGAVKDIPSGVSGHLGNTNPFSRVMGQQPRQERTPLVEIIKQIDARKGSPKKTPAKSARSPRRKLITDDFGEPVRWVWED